MLGGSTRVTPRKSTYGVTTPDSDVPASMIGEPTSGCRFDAELKDGETLSEARSFPVFVLQFAIVVEAVKPKLSSVPVWPTAAPVPLTNRSLKSDVRFVNVE